MIINQQPPTSGGGGGGGATYTFEVQGSTSNDACICVPSGQNGLGFMTFQPYGATGQYASGEWVFVCCTGDYTWMDYPIYDDWTGRPMMISFAAKVGNKNQVPMVAFPMPECNAHCMFMED